MGPEHEASRLYDAFGALLYRHALMILGNREAAEDVIQQVFVGVLERDRAASAAGAERGFPHIHDIERYLRRAVRNACYTTLRARRFWRALPLDDGILESASIGRSAVEEADRLALQAAMRLLPAHQREVLHLHVFEGRTFKEVSAITGESLNTVASRYRYAIEKMKAIFPETKQ